MVFQRGDRVGGSGQGGSGLSRDRIVHMAVQLADREGIEGLSIRKLAERLDAAPMALYRHVANKEDLVDGMVDVVYGEVETPTGIGWKAAMRQRAISMRATLLAHPWAVGVLEARSPGPANLRYHNAGIACLRENAGLPIRMAIDAYNLMDSYLYGFALQEKRCPATSPQRPRRDVKPCRERTRRWPRPTPTSSRWSMNSRPRSTTTPSSLNGALSTSSTRSNSSAHDQVCSAHQLTPRRSQLRGSSNSRSTAAVTGRRVYVDRASKEGHVCAALWFVAADAVHPAGRRGPDFSAAGRRSSHSGARRAYTYSSTHSPFHHALCRWCASRRIRR